MSRVVQVRDVPDEVHEALVRQARREGLSLNQFVLREYERIARRSRNADVFARAAERPGRRPTRAEILQSLREVREHGE